MTKNREVRLEDLNDCDHDAEVPVSEDGEIVHWLCRCGRVVADADGKPLPGATG